MEPIEELKTTDVTKEERERIKTLIKPFLRSTKSSLKKIPSKSDIDYIKSLLEKGIYKLGAFDQSIINYFTDIKTTEFSPKEIEEFLEELEQPYQPITSPPPITTTSRRDLEEVFAPQIALQKESVDKLSELVQEFKKEYNRSMTLNELYDMAKKHPVLIPALKRELIDQFLKGNIKDVSELYRLRPTEEKDIVNIKQFLKPSQKY